MLFQGSESMESQVALPNKVQEVMDNSSTISHYECSPGVPETKLSQVGLYSLAVSG